VVVCGIGNDQRLHGRRRLPRAFWLAVMDQAGSASRALGLNHSIHQLGLDPSLGKPRGRLSLLANYYLYCFCCSRSL